MRHASIKTGLVLCVSIASAMGFYEAGAQALLTFSGNVHAKMVWVRSSQGKAQDYTSNSRLVVLDTREGGARVLDNEVGVHIWPKITHDGKYVIWNVGPGEWAATTSSWICAWDGSGKKLLIDGSKPANPGHVLSTWIDAAGQNYVFAAKAGGSRDSVFRIPLNGMSVDMTQKKPIYGGSQITPVSFNISNDGKFTAFNCPWPMVARYNLLTMTIDTVERNTNDDLGMACMPYVCPDGSGWLSHMEESHTQIITISPDNKTRTTFNAAKGMPGNRGMYDVLNPMWSNHPMFLSAMYPLQTTSARGEFCVGKYKDRTFSAVDWICVTDTADATTYREGLGDLWLEGVPTGSMSSPHTMRLEAAVMTVAPVASGYLIDVSADGAHSVDIIAPSGRCIRSLKGTGNAQYVINAGELARGVCLMTLSSGTSRLTKTIIVK